VQLIATAHGRYLGDLLKNPVLSDLVGGVQSVTLGDEEARTRGTQKSILERRGPVTFTTTIVRHFCKLSRESPGWPSRMS
jgi:stage III sporulation protein SpoIIIAA